MVQTGLAKSALVRDWMKIETKIAKPRQEHPKRPVEGFACARSEVSGRRLWGLFAERWNRPEDFFEGHFVANYCPLAFFDAEGRNLTPDKLTASQSSPLLAACDAHLRGLVGILQPEWLVGVGDYADKRGQLALKEVPVSIGRILHQSCQSRRQSRLGAQSHGATGCARNLLKLERIPPR